MNHDNIFWSFCVLLMTFHSTMAGNGWHIFKQVTERQHFNVWKKLIPWLKGCGVSPNGFPLWKWSCNDLHFLSFLRIYVGETRRVNHGVSFIGSYNVTIYGDMLTYSFGIQTHNVKWELHGLFNVVVFFPRPDVITWLMVIQKNLQKPWKSLIFLLGNDRKKWSKLPVHKGWQLKIIKWTNYMNIDAGHIINNYMN